MRVESQIDFAVSPDWAHFYAHRGLEQHRDWMHKEPRDRVEADKLWTEIQADLAREKHEWNLRLRSAASSSPSLKGDSGFSGSVKQVEWAEDIILKRHEQAHSEADYAGLRRLLTEHSDAVWWIETKGARLETLLKRGKVSLEDL